jgi:hypothetical protein
MGGSRASKKRLHHARPYPKNKMGVVGEEWVITDRRYP